MTSSSLVPACIGTGGHIVRLRRYNCQYYKFLLGICQRTSGNIVRLQQYPRMKLQLIQLVFDVYYHVEQTFEILQNDNKTWMQPLPARIVAPTIISSQLELAKEETAELLA